MIHVVGSKLVRITWRDPVLKYQINKQTKDRKAPKENKIKFNEIIKFIYSLVEIKTWLFSVVLKPCLRLPT